MKKLKVVIGSDHAAVALKQELQSVRHLGQVSVIWEDVGTNGEERVDYPDFAQKVTQAVSTGKADRGVLICGSGIGMSIAANRDKRIRAAMIYSDEAAALARQHNDANVACFGSRTQQASDIRRWIEIFMNTDYEGGRHDVRLKKLSP